MSESIEQLRGMSLDIAVVREKYPDAWYEEDDKTCWGTVWMDRTRADDSRKILAEVTSQGEPEPEAWAYAALKVIEADGYSFHLRGTNRWDWKHYPSQSISDLMASCSLALESAKRHYLTCHALKQECTPSPQVGDGTQDERREYGEPFSIVLRALKKAKAETYSAPHSEVLGRCIFEVSQLALTYPTHCSCTSGGD